MRLAAAMFGTRATIASMSGVLPRALPRLHPCRRITQYQRAGK